ncbi:MAG: transglutaminase-like domain-containing protein [Verrucomicrobia bacterium]|nr:transglutaminase-like domain-containing protein [Verrucomicrobiota bacterium]
MTRRTTCRLLILTIWLILVGWLIRFEAFPEFFTHSLSGYQGLLSRDVMVADNWMRILYKGHPIGYSHSSVEVNEGDSTHHYILLNRMYVRLKAMGFEQPVFVDTEAYIDILHRLQRFSFELSSRDYKMNMSARRGDGKTFLGQMVTGNSRQALQFDIPDDVILYSPMTEMGVKKLAPGESLSIRTFDPATLTPTTLRIRAENRETIVVGTNHVPATRLVTEYQGVETLSWIDADGEMIKQETPFGWSMEACTADEALETIHSAGYSGDVIADLAIRLTGTINNPTGAMGLRLRVSGAAIDGATLETERQHVTASDESGFELIVRPSFFPNPGDRMVLPEVERRRYLESTPFVQADHPDIRQVARSIVKGGMTDREQAFAIYEWVHKNVRKEITISLPSALDVLKTKAGDCNEHTYLYTALARSVGLPTRIMIGVAYHKGAFYYHAWPAVYVGRWVEMDPTWGQPTVDATHIRLLEGELNDQVGLIKFAGQVRLDLLEEM